MEYVLIVQWIGSCSFATYLFDNRKEAIDELKRQSEQGHLVSLYKTIREEI